MCNLYSITCGQEAMRRLFAVARDMTGNLPPRPGREREARHDGEQKSELPSPRKVDLL